MKILEINQVNFGSTGHIMLQIADLATKKGHEVICSFYARRNKDKDKNCIYIGNKVSHNIHKKLYRKTGNNGCYSKISTWNFLRKVKKFDPDLIHIHNLHNCYINLPMLFDYIKKNNKKVVWTLHDCWSFTGQCPYFTAVGCEKWKTGCHDCEQINRYPSCSVDRTDKMWNRKKEWFTGVQNLTIVTPSQWLADLVKQSFLKDYPVKVINNGIDLDVFKPTESDFRTKHNLEDKKIILGVASVWEVRKGLDVFIELSKRLDDRYKIVLVGTNDEVDKKLPEGIISIHRTSNQKELAELYTAADVFFIPTREDNFPTVNMESLACGTPVLTFNTGGSPEMVDEATGVVLMNEDRASVEQAVISMCESGKYSKEACTERAKQYDSGLKYNEYLSLFENI